MISKVFSFLKKNFKWFVWAIGLIAIVVMGGVLSNSKKQNHDYKVRIEALESEIADKDQLIEKLASLEAIRCEVNVSFKFRKRKYVNRVPTLISTIENETVITRTDNLILGQ